MKVMFIGFFKTGTKTMHAALKQLGYEVYDYDKNFYYLGKQWLKIMSEEGGTKEDFYNMYKDVDATVDSPACHFWEEILEAFPDTKLIYNERKSEEEWWRSLDKTIKNMNSNLMMILLVFLSPTAYSFFQFGHRVGCVGGGAPKQRFWTCFKGISPTVAKMIYRNHNARVKERAPKEQLLIFSPSEGWEPLCKFLGKPVPDLPFPYKNKGGTVVDEYLKESPVFQKMKQEMMISLSVLVVVAAVIFLYFVVF